MEHLSLILCFLTLLNENLSTQMADITTNMAPKFIHSQTCPYQPNHGQTLIEKALYSGKFCSGQLLQRTQFFGTTRLAQAKFTSL